MTYDKTQEASKFWILATTKHESRFLIHEKRGVVNDWLRLGVHDIPKRLVLAQVLRWDNLKVIGLKASPMEW